MEFEYNFLHHFAWTVAHRMPYISALSIYMASLQGYKKSFSSSPWFVLEVTRNLFFEYPGAFQLLPLSSIPRCEEKRFMWPCSELLWLC